MNPTPPEIPARRPQRRTSLAPTATIMLAISFGLCAGYLDVGILLFRKYCWNSEGYVRNASDFPWTVPVGHAVLMVVPGLLVVAASRLRPAPLSLRARSWLFATVALWSALLRMPLYSSCAFLLAAGIGRVAADAVAAHGWRPPLMRFSVAAILGVLGVLTFVSSAWPAIREYHTVAGLRPPRPAARNVVLIVWDTVRASNLGLYGYSRNTTPNLARWARQGVTYKHALAPAPWSFPSHSSFFTGQWPFQLNSQRKFRLNVGYPTLAERLASSGYQCAGFVANTGWCSYESGLDRGFAHFEDYPLTPRSLLSRTVLGKWLLTNILSLGRFYEMKWVNFQSRDASEINDAFLQWLTRRRPDRPFFAFLNFFDAHEPYVPPPGYEGRFGIRPRSVRDFRFIIDFMGIDKKNQVAARDTTMARDCYDDCIAFLDDQLGRLLDALQDRGLLDDTVVIITSDHGEGFGEHGMFGHGYTVNLEETGVPLVILSPAAPAGRVVESPVTLRDLPATVVDLLGVSAASPFPGRSLSAYWKLAPGLAPPGITSPAFSEQANSIAFEIQPGHDRGHSGFEMSLAALGRHFIRDGIGNEKLYDLKADPFEQMNLTAHVSGSDETAVFRRMLLDVLTDNPGAFEAEKFYLANYRKRLEDLVRANSTQSVSESSSVGP
jgi:arylsulfatase A-like enzyme